jgi:putative N6-adenine-specific DNA methylase
VRPVPRQGRRRAPRRDTQWPDIRIYAHLTTDTVSLYIDTSGEALFKRGWREDKGEAPLKETLAAAMIAASGWAPTRRSRCTTRAAAAARSPSRRRRSPATSRLAAAPVRLREDAAVPAHVWEAMRETRHVRAQRCPRPGSQPDIFGSDVAHRMVDFAQRNAAAPAWPM